MNALVFLYKRVLEKPLEGTIDAARSTKAPRVPVVLTREEVARALPLIEGKAGLVVRRLYGSGLWITEAVRPRVRDLDFGYRQITVRSGKGGSDRVTTFPRILAEPSQDHFAKVRTIHKVIWSWVMARSTFHLRWRRSIPARRRNGIGNMYFLR